MQPNFKKYIHFLKNLEKKKISLTSCVLKTFSINHASLWASSELVKLNATQSLYFGDAYIISKGRL